LVPEKIKKKGSPDRSECSGFQAGEREILLPPPSDCFPPSGSPGTDAFFFKTRGRMFLGMNDPAAAAPMAGKRRDNHEILSDERCRRRDIRHPQATIHSVAGGMESSRQRASARRRSFFFEGQTGHRRDDKRSPPTSKKQATG
jgi:hypothetical protein